MIDLTNVDVVVFDVDDTLYLERDYVASGFAHLDAMVKSEFGVNGFAATAWRCFLEGRRGDIFDATLRKLGAQYDASQVAKIVDAYRGHAPRISLLPDARILISQLLGEGREIGILTDGPAASQVRKVDALGLRDVSDLVICTDLYGAGFGKPNIRGFLEIVDRSAGESYAYLADNPLKDFIAPQELGWMTVRVRRPGGLHQQKKNQGDVDYTCSDFSTIEI